MHQAEERAGLTLHAFHGPKIQEPPIKAWGKEKNEGTRSVFRKSAACVHVLGTCASPCLHVQAFFFPVPPPLSDASQRNGHFRPTHTRASLSDFLLPRFYALKEGTKKNLMEPPISRLKIVR